MKTIGNQSLIRGFGFLCRAPVYRSINTQARRRAWVVVSVVVLAGLLLGIWFNPGEPRVAIGGILVLAFLMVGVGAATQGMADMSMKHLDEQQRSMRLSLFPDPYPLGATVGILGGTIMMTVLNSERELLASPIVVAVYGFPALVMAWKLPDTEFEDE